MGSDKSVSFWSSIASGFGKALIAGCWASVAFSWLLSIGLFIYSSMMVARFQKQEGQTVLYGLANSNYYRLQAEDIPGHFVIIWTIAISAFILFVRVTYGKGFRGWWLATGIHILAGMWDFL